MTDTRRRGHWSRDGLWVAGLVAGAALVWFFRVVSSATAFTFSSGDAFGYFLPAYVYEAARLADGALPLWNPYQGAGVPFVAVLQPAALYPPRLLALLLPPARAMGWSIFGHVLLALIGTYALCRRLETSAAAAALGAIVFTTAFVLPTIYTPSLVEPASWLPVLALAVIAVVQGGGWRWVIALGVSAAMPVLAGGYQVTLYAVYGVAFFVVATAANDPGRTRANASAIVLRLAAAGLLALATAAPQLLPTLAWSANTVRRTAPLTDIQTMVLFTEAARAVRLRAFFLRGSSSDLCHLSIPVVALATIGLLRRRPLGLVLGLGALGTAALSLTHPGTVSFAIYRALPGLAMFRFPSRLLVLTALMAAVAAALGLDALVRLLGLAESPRRRLVEAGGLALVVALCVLPYRNESQLPWTVPLEAAGPDRSFFPPSSPPPPGERVWVPGDRFELKLGMFVRQGMLRRVRVLSDYEPLSSRRLAGFLAAVAGKPPPGADAFPIFAGSMLGQQPIARPDLLDLVSIRAIVTPERTLPGGEIPGWTQIAKTADIVTFRNARALPRAYVVGRARFVADETQALATITDRAFDPRTEAVIVGVPADDGERALAGAAPTPVGLASIVTDDPEHVAVEVDATQPGVLVLADAFAPGWEATVDGLARPLWQANYLVRGVALRPGDRRVDFRYRAPGFGLGVSVAGAVWSGVLVATALRMRRRAP